ncbi:hypothetical protein R3P38DRAFT_3547985, partial [Favolaschia claudopus]
LSQSPWSLQTIHETLENAAYYLQPFVDAIQERFGMCASVLLAGPVGMRGGMIGVQSVHAGQTKGLAPMNWPTYDWKGFEQVERSMISFAKECYTQVECDARAVKTNNYQSTVSIPDAPDAPSTNNAAAAVASNTPTPPPPPAPTTDDPPPPPPATNPTTRTDNAALPADDNGEDAPPNDDEGDGVPRDDVAESWDEYWQRDDRPEWFPQLSVAHAAFARGRRWGEGWALCEWHFDEGSFLMGKKNRPRPVGAWIHMGRRWSLPPTLGAELGTRETPDLWVGSWWAWWESLQPDARVRTGAELSRADDADWGEMALMHGSNGLLQVMASLFWWGDVVQRKREAEEVKAWEAAVDDVAWVLNEILKSGEIERAMENGDDEAGDAGGNEVDKGKGRSKGRQGRGTSKKRPVEATNDGENDGENDGGGRPQKKRKTREEVNDAPRRSARNQTAESQNDGRTTRSRSAANASASRPQPRARYKGAK